MLERNEGNCERFIGRAEWLSCFNAPSFKCFVILTEDRRRGDVKTGPPVVFDRDVRGKRVISKRPVHLTTCAVPRCNVPT